MERRLIEIVEQGKFVLEDVPGSFEANAARLCAEALLGNKLIEFRDRNMSRGPRCKGKENSA